MLVNYYYDLTCSENCDTLLLCGDCAAELGDDVQFAQRGEWDSCCMECRASNSEEEDDEEEEDEEEEDEEEEDEEEEDEKW